ncbi:hypothetical protein [Dyella ginsengisoli]|uniref:hypothetical protein n=1 Tax=Dyella ginsengisoli TaxID=363848 RepID=UPI00384D1BCF
MSGPDRSGERGLDGGAEAIGSECVLALKMQPDRLDILVGECFQFDGAVGSVAISARRAEALVDRVRMDE